MSYCASIWGSIDNESIGLGGVWYATDLLPQPPFCHCRVEEVLCAYDSARLQPPAHICFTFSPSVRDRLTWSLAFFASLYTMCTRVKLPREI